jgi:ubiquinone/menaquinone biosynthesis C-methylase UbiE
VSSDPTETVRRSLERGEIHDTWESAYRSEANERFYEQAFDVLLAYAGAPPGTVFLDVGCGPGFHTLRLARRGYRVRAVDFSPFALELARKNIDVASLPDQIELGQEDLLALSFADDSFERILCWGVLMHIPEVERAIGEVSRVLAPGGRLIVSEANMHSLEATLVRGLRQAFGRRKDSRRTPAGIENWTETPAGPLMTRYANIGWLVEAFAAQDLRLIKRLPEQFSEAYTKLGPPFGRPVHVINRLWLRYVRSPVLAADNILVLEKQSG